MWIYHIRLIYDPTFHTQWETFQEKLLPQQHFFPLTLAWMGLIQKPNGCSWELAPAMSDNYDKATVILKFLQNTAKFI